MLLELRIAMLRRGVRQSRMAVNLGWDPAKLSRIVNELQVPTPNDRRAIAKYLGMNEVELFDETTRPTARRNRVAARHDGFAEVVP